MYAVIKTGGKQYKVTPGLEVDVEKINGAIGSEIQLSEVLLFSDGDNVKVGQPLVTGARVTAKILSQKKAAKVTIFKKIRRHGYHLKKGHRQNLTRLLIDTISA
ncbi:MAG: 50S ribosomal protein L21 [Deltaproteobacteria bacterium]|nr:50S ribosomal protein L21 [Deltaproteobacteria bacterium]